MIKFSIVLISYNSADFLDSCLDSLKKVDGLKQAEVLLWDNNSSDSTISIAQKYDFVKIIESDKNLGFGRAVNEAADMATGEYLVLLNPDTQVDKNWLLGLYQTFTTHDRVGAANSKTMISIDGKAFIQNAGNYVFADGYSRDRGAVVTKDHRQLYELDSVFYNQEKEVMAFSGVSVMIKRNLFTKLGGFDEHMFMYYEDVDLSLRLKKLGYSIWYQPMSTLLHLHSASSKEWSSFFILQTELNRLLFVWKHFSLKRAIFELLKFKLSALKMLFSGNRLFLTKIQVLIKFSLNFLYLLTYRAQNA